MFTPGLLHDLAGSELSEDFEVRLFDINHESSEVMAKVGNRIAKVHGSTMKVVSCSDRRDALKDANFVTTTIAVGAAEG